MRSKVFNIATLLCILSVATQAQYRLSGTVVSAADSASVRACDVYLENVKRTTITDNRGKFVFEDVPNGTYIIHFANVDFRYEKITVTIKDGDANVRIRLQDREQVLEEVMISDVQTDFGFTRMRAVENMGIYEGKKSEVIIPEQLVANLATNNARQLYSRVAGLNIWENDGVGLQLSIGGRGLDPNRSSNFNIRQNGYDISADALGYPESYYTPPAEGIGRIEIVRGAASLQYGTQFGGLINFEMKKPVADKKLELVARQSVGSFGFYNAFTSASGTVNKVSYYGFFQYKRSDGWRKNSDLDNYNVYANVNYAFNDNARIGVDITQMSYLAQQPGGLNNTMFNENPRQTNRERNWFKVNWNLLALHFDHKFNASRELNVRVFGLSAHRYAVGFRPNRATTVDDGSRRDLMKGEFQNWGAEARFLNRYNLGTLPGVLLAGTRYYHGFNHSKQGFGSTGKDADFNFVDEDQFMKNDYRFPNRNVAFFVENILYLHDKLSITPGLRYEYINTIADGFYATFYEDLAGNIIEVSKTPEYRKNERQFVIAGLGITFRPTIHTETYTNFSQNYRSITFNDMRIDNKSLVIDPDMTDEKGYSFDAGIRSDQTALYNFDVSVFHLNYDNRIGEILLRTSTESYRKRTNIGQAVIQGIEAYGEIDVLGFIWPQQDAWSGVLFNNIALIRSTYKKSDIPNVEGRNVEFVPDVNLKSGLRLGYHDLKVSAQYTLLSEQLTDASNSEEKSESGVTGPIPGYAIIDLGIAYQFKRFRVEGNINNLTNTMYFTRRATGYPGPGAIPSDGRSFFVTLQVKI